VKGLSHHRELEEVEGGKRRAVNDMHAEESVEINRPIAEVFSYAAEPQNMPEWTSLVQEVQKEGQGQLKEGDRFTVIAKFLGRSSETPFEVSVHQPPRRYSAKSVGGPFDQESTYTFEETAGGGTRLTCVVEVEPGGFYKLAGPLLEAAGKRQYRADLGTLKDLLEAQG
jgi:uncharacterized membrane protein